jgi:hypothetical protein
MGQGLSSHRPTAAAPAAATAGGEARATAMAEFYAKWEKEPLVLLKWFALQVRARVGLGAWADARRAAIPACCPGMGSWHCPGQPGTLLPLHVWAMLPPAAAPLETTRLPPPLPPAGRQQRPRQRGGGARVGQAPRLQHHQPQQLLLAVPGLLPLPRQLPRGWVAVEAALSIALSRGQCGCKLPCLICPYACTPGHTAASAPSALNHSPACPCLPLLQPTAADTSSWAMLCCRWTRSTIRRVCWWLLCLLCRHAFGLL